LSSAGGSRRFQLVSLKGDRSEAGILTATRLSRGSQAAYAGNFSPAA
jgi:hypothetical protein